VNKILASNDKIWKINLISQVDFSNILEITFLSQNFLKKLRKLSHFKFEIFDVGNFWLKKDVYRLDYNMENAILLTFKKFAFYPIVVNDFEGMCWSWISKISENNFRIWPKKAIAIGKIDRN